MSKCVECENDNYWAPDCPANADDIRVENCWVADCTRFVPKTCNSAEKLEETKMDTIQGRTAAHAKICQKLTTTYEQKNRDYGDSFHQTFLDEGFAMARIRLSDKLNRFKTLSKGADQQVSDESIKDTLMDLANYAIMTVMEIERSKQ